MAALLQRILTGEISPPSLISWLCANELDEGEDLLLSDFQKLRVEFVPYFLNYIHEECSWLVRSSNRSSQSPRKLPCNVSNDSAISDVFENKAHKRSKSVIITKDVKVKCELNKSFSSLESSGSSIKEFDSFKTADRFTTFSGSDRNTSHKSSKIQIRQKRNKFNSSKSVQYNNSGKNKYPNVNSSFSSDESNRNDENINTLIQQKNNSTFNENKRFSKAPNINDFEAFPPVGTVISPVKSSPRRIKPTPLQKRTNKDIKLNSPLGSPIVNPVFHTPPQRECNNVFQSTPVKDSRDSNFNEERELLRRTRNHIHNSSLNTINRNFNLSYTSSLSIDDEISDISLLSQVSAHSFSSERDFCNYIMPEFKLISEKNNLDLLINLYSGFIENCLVHNVSIELYFLFQLLTSNTKVFSRCNVMGNLEEVNCFYSFHNCIYFAVNVLYRQKNLLALIEQPTLNLLTKLPYLSAFSNELAKTLHNIYASTPVINRRILQPIQGVSYQADTDNRANFPTSNSFHIFRKQRDLFYELLREWQNNHLIQDWNLNSAFIYKVQHLLRLGSDPANFSHLGRLIQSQLITTCCGRAELKEEREQQHRLKESYPEKLQERFSAPSKIGDPSPAPAFHGFQAFFKDFLLAAKSAELNQHLIDLLATKILEINNIDILCESESGALEENIREQFLCALHTLQLLGKFLGFLVFFPYQTTEVITNEMISCQAHIRNNVLPPLDLITILKEALEAQRLILTVPWIVEYLSMMDPVAPFLIYYQDANNILFRIYKKDLVNANTLNQNFLRLILGWLFETPCFPKSFFFQETGKTIENKTSSQEHISKNRNVLDTLPVVDINIVSLCCPYLIELRVLLENYFKGIHSNGKEIRKITPISTVNLKTVGNLTAKQLENKLEDNFFHLHPASMKKTVEFVAGRITSKAIGSIRNSMIPEAHILIINMVKEKINESNLSIYDSCDNIIHQSLTEEITTKVYTDVKSKINHFFEKFCPQEIQKVLPLLLPEDAGVEVIKTCVKIASQMSSNKVSEWVRANVTESYLHTTVKTEIEKIMKKKETPESFKIIESDKNTTQRTETIPVMEIIISLRKYIVNIQQSACTTADVLQLLHLTEQCLDSNRGLTIISVKAISLLTVDLLITLIIYQPDVCSSSLLNFFVKFWCEHTPQCLSVSKVICPRNIQMMLQSGNDKCSWSVLKELTVKLLECESLSPQDLLQNVQLIMKQEWPINHLQSFKHCIEDLLDSNKIRQNEYVTVELQEIGNWLERYMLPVEALA